MDARRKWFLVLFPVLGAVLVGLLSVGTGLNPNPPDPDMQEKRNRIIVMLGDSITQGTDWNRLLNRVDVVNRGVSGDTVSEFLDRLQPIIRSRPQICLIMGGINDISRGYAVEATYRDYVLVLKELIDAGIRPVVQSTLRVGAGFFESLETNRKVDELNEKLKNFTRQNDIDFIDLNWTLSGEDGLVPDYTDDGVHLSKEGYRAWRDILKPFLEQINDVP